MNKLYFGLAASRIKKALEDSEIAEAYDNQVLKGRAREIFISDIFKPFLIRNFEVCTGHIIDSVDGHSRQIDIIVFDSRVIPPIMLAEGEGIIPYEAVLATIEVKTTLNAEELDKSIENARSIKVLNPNFQEILKTDKIKHTPVCYIFAFSSDLTAKDELKRLEERVEKSNEGKPKIDVPISGLCVANKCFLYCRKADCSPPQFMTIARDGNHLNILEFLLNLVNTCSNMAAEREQLYLDMYLK
jgi:hypothetical protein